MSAEIGVGSVVRCIRISNGLPTPKGYRVGGIYRVSDVHVYCGRPQINCYGRWRPEDFGLSCLGWSLSSFEPIGGSSTTIADLIRIGSERKVGA